VDESWNAIHICVVRELTPFPANAKYPFFTAMFRFLSSGIAAHLRSFSNSGSREIPNCAIATASVDRRAAA
jgi:hypothetical protein